MESPLRPPNEPDFRLIETLAYQPGDGFVRKAAHLSRMARTARALELPFDLDAANRALQPANGDQPLRCRLTLDTSGCFDLTIAALADKPPLWRVAIADQVLASDDPWLRHKTTRRAVYDTARAALPDGVDELLFLNERAELCEGTITNLFIEVVDGTLVTPALSCGLLPGILRQELLDKETVTEAVLSLTDLQNASSLFVGNSLRGLIPAKWVKT